jgi:hypothetical protein
MTAIAVSSLRAKQNNPHLGNSGVFLVLDCQVMLLLAMMGVA